MRKRRTGGVGSVSLVLIFATLCLSIFAVLSLSDAVSQKHTADLLAESAENYYAADTLAVRVYAALAEHIRAGEDVPAEICGVAVAKNTAEDGTHYRFACGIDDSQILQVETVQADGRLTILRWAKAAREEWVGDDDILVWH